MNSSSVKIRVRTDGAKPRVRAWGLLVNTLAIVGMPAVIIAVWWFGSAGSTNYLNPPLSNILDVFGPTWFKADASGHSLFISDVVPGLGRFAVGYACAIILGVALGVVIGSSARLRAFVEPAYEFLRAVPPAILVPVLMLFLGIGDSLRIVVIAVGSIWPILLNAIDGVRGIDPVLRDVAAGYRFGWWTRLVRLTLPGASPQIVTGARQALPVAIIMMVISEMFAAKDGLGAAIVVFQKSFAIPQMWGGVILLGAIGVALSFLFKLATDPILAWYRGYLKAQRGN